MDKTMKSAAVIGLSIVVAAWVFAQTGRYQVVTTEAVANEGGSRSRSGTTRPTLVVLDTRTGDYCIDISTIRPNDPPDDPRRLTLRESLYDGKRAERFCREGSPIIPRG